MTVASPHLPKLPGSLQFIERDWLSANHIIGFDEDGVTLVDTGYDKHKLLTCELIAKAIGERPLKRIINTHLHADHCGGNAALQARFGCAITVPQASWSDVQTWNEKVLTYQGTAQKCDRFTASGVIEVGQEWHMGGVLWQAHSAPGHDPKSLIFFAPEERILISADALWGNGYGVLFPELDGLDASAEQAAVLRLIESLAPSLVLPGHGPMFTDVAAAISRARVRLEAMRKDRRKHASNALKVLMKFLLLDQEKIEIAQLPIILKDAAIMTRASEILGMSAIDAVTLAYRQLVAAGHLRMTTDQRYLLN